MGVVRCKASAERFCAYSANGESRLAHRIVRAATLLAELGRLRAAQALVSQLRGSADEVHLAEAEYSIGVRVAGLGPATASLKGVVARNGRNHLAMKLVRSQIDMGDYKSAVETLAAHGMTWRMGDVPALLTRIALMCPELRPKISDIISEAASESGYRTDICQCMLSLKLADGTLEFHNYHDVGELRPPLPDDIPYQLFQYWDSEDVPEDVAACMRSWRNTDGAPAQIIFDSGAAERFLELDYDRRFVEAYGRCHHAAMKSDFIRLAFLYRRGGIYIDFDEVCVRPLWGEYQGWKHSSIVLVVARSTPATLQNGFIGAKPGCEIIKSALDEAITTLLSENRPQQPDVWHATGPGLVTRAFVRTMGSASSGVRTLPSTAHYRTISRDAPQLKYKSTQKGNWRLA